MNPDTVVIVLPDHPDGRVTINESDYDPTVHTLYAPEAEAEATEAEAPVKPKGKRP